MLLGFLRELFSGNLDTVYLAAFLPIVAGVLLSISAHECAHGLAAYWQGDTYAKNTGRLTLNPFKHLDPLGKACAGGAVKLQTRQGEYALRSFCRGCVQYFHCLFADEFIVFLHFYLRA